MQNNQKSQNIVFKIELATQYIVTSESLTDTKYCKKRKGYL